MPARRLVKPNCRGSFCLRSIVVWKYHDGRRSSGAEPLLEAAIETRRHRVDELETVPAAKARRSGSIVQDLAGDKRSQP
jgi:hypothetical protein